MDLISIIVPVYKVEPYLRQCIDSIINQTYRNLEIILVDDGSPDNCPSICDEYAQKDPRIKVIHRKNGGLGAARNSGLEIASGNFIGFVDSDDYIAPQMFESLLKAFRDDIGVVSCDILYNRYGYFEPFFTSLGLNNLKQLTVHPSILLRLILIDYEIEPMVWNKLYRFKVIEGIKFIENRNNEDLVFQYEISKKLLSLNLSFERISGYYYYYRYLDNSISQSKIKPLIFDSILNFREIINDAEKNQSIYFNDLKSCYNKLLLQSYDRIFDSIDIYNKYAKIFIPFLKEIPINTFLKPYSFLGKIKVFIYILLILKVPFTHKYLIKKQKLSI